MSEKKKQKNSEFLDENLEDDTENEEYLDDELEEDNTAN